MINSHRQRGATLISMIVMIAVAAFLLVIGAKSLPIYLNHFKIASIMKNIAGQPGAARDTIFEIRTKLERRFDIDMVKHYDDRTIKIINIPGGARALHAKYEVRVHMFYNVDAIYAFEEKVPLKN